MEIMEMEEDLEVTRVGDISASEDEDADDDRIHSKLLDAISSLDGKRKVKFSQRTVPAAQISEFNFAASGDRGKVKLHELVGTLKDTTSHGDLKKQLRSIQKQNKVVTVPLPKHEKDKVQRSVAYESTSKELTKWDPIVETNRKADQLKFPLQRPSLQLHTTDQFVKRFQPRTPLELEVAALLQGSQNVQPKDRILTPAEEKALRAMSLEEARERRAELQKYRALLSYKETKAKREKRIKSKKYHRVRRKEREKKEKKALEEMQQKDPEGYLEKLEQADRTRIQERMSLKHRGGSKFAKKQMMYAKFDDKTRQSVQDMLQKSRELTQKTRPDSDTESESGVSVDSHSDEEADSAGGGSSARVKNPWMSVTVRASEKMYERPKVVLNRELSASTEQKDIEGNIESEKLTDTVVQEESDINNSIAHDNDRYEEKESDQIEQIFSHLEENKAADSKKSRDLSTKNKSKKKLKNQMTSKVETTVPLTGTKANFKGNNQKVSDPATDEVEEEVITETLTRKRTLEEVEADWSDEEETGSDVTDLTSIKQSSGQNAKKDKNRKSEKADDVEEIYVDPKKLFTLESRLNRSQVPNIAASGEENIDLEEEQRMTIAQAFADDDVIDEFSREKSVIEDRDKPKDIDLSLPGWGNWGGAGIKPSKRKTKRFLIKAHPAEPRKDQKLGNVIISELKDKAIAKHQVSELPFPYSSVAQFEQSIRAPVGKTWNPETAYKQLVKPKVVTKLGTVIEPIDKSELFKKQRPGKRKPDLTFGSTNTGTHRQSVKKQRRRKGK